MTDEQAFLDRLRANPHDRPTRLIYADWLEERGDERAAVLRLETAAIERCPVCATSITDYRDEYFEMETGYGSQIQLSWIEADCPLCSSPLEYTVANKWIAHRDVNEEGFSVIIWRLVHKAP